MATRAGVAGTSMPLHWLETSQPDDQACHTYFRLLDDYRRCRVEMLGRLPGSPRTTQADQRAPECPKMPQNTPRFHPMFKTNPIHRAPMSTASVTFPRRLVSPSWSMKAPREAVMANAMVQGFLLPAVSVVGAVFFVVLGIIMTSGRHGA
jgi:hypothetical protein